MGTPALKLTPPDDRAADSLRAGRLVRHQLLALGMTDAEIAEGAPVDASDAEVTAWLEDRGPCPAPR